MKKVAVWSLAVLLVMVFVSATSVFAATPDEVKAMVDKAAAFFKANGKAKTIDEINNPKGQFVKGDLYVFMNDVNGTVLANGGNPKLVGQNHLELKDPSGKLFNKESAETAKTKGSGWIDYMWANPVTKKFQPKTVWVQKIEGTEFYLGCGLWK
jgi:signal transduction histidine kinase